ncbi:hypothetical protein ACFFKU_09950 [Kineococcus gynurae]|uniref:Uncharacterized protein n=1 Tax=Kineococcus gynurae TaxID=452979 RepID=A0ABV5LVF6_9ACTN
MISLSSSSTSAARLVTVAEQQVRAARLDLTTATATGAGRPLVQAGEQALNRAQADLVSAQQQAVRICLAEDRVDLYV